MSRIDGTDRGTPDEFEVIWRSGAVDRFVAHQVTWHGGDQLSAFLRPEAPETPKRVKFHAEIDGCWTLMLDALESDLLSVRNLTQLGSGLDS